MNGKKRGKLKWFVKEEHIRFSFLSHMQAMKAQTILRIRSVLLKLSQVTYTSLEVVEGSMHGSRGGTGGLYPLKNHKNKRVS